MPAPDSPAQADLALLDAAAAAAGVLAMRYFGRNPEVWLKNGNSPVTEADLAVNRLLREELLAARPEYGWLSEEDVGHAPDAPQGAPVFVVDPIDGTRAFIEGKPLWCISIAIVHAGRPMAGVLHCPAREEVFLALRGGGATRNGERIAVGKPGGILNIAGPKYMLDRVPHELRRRLQPADYVPSLAYRIAMVADGRLDATFVRPNAHDWDLAAADLIVEEAGGAILDDRGDRLRYSGQDRRHGEMIVGSGELLARLQASVRAHEMGNDR